jgi:hypothetical protein
MGSLEVIARNRWFEPLSTWPAHNENHKTTLAGNSLFDDECLRCWLERIAVMEYENISRIGGEDYMHAALQAMVGNYILDRVIRYHNSKPGNAEESGMTRHFLTMVRKNEPCWCLSCNDYDYPVNRALGVAAEKAKA